MAGVFSTDVTVTFEAAFGDNPLTTGRTWTDISTDVRRFQTDRGRDGFVTRIRTGKATVALDNNAGNYDPSSTMGAFTPDVKPMVPFRISATYTSTDGMKLDTVGRGLGNSLQTSTAVLFTGFIESLPQEWRDGNDAMVTMKATDGIKLWNQLQGAGTPYGPGNIRQMIKDILISRNWPAAWIDGYTAAFDAQPFTPAGSILRSLRLLEDTEDGLLFIQANGEAMFQHRAYRSGLTPSVIFGDGSTELDYTLDMDMVEDDHQIWNKVSVQRRGGTVAQTTSDTGSVDSFMERELSRRGSLHVSDADAATLATALVTRYKDPSLRLDAINFTPRVDPTRMWPVALSFDISTKLTVNRRPPGGNTISLDSFVEGVEHRGSVGKDWTTTFRLSQYA